MNFDQLYYFCAIVKYNSFSDAADELNISQSALSKQIIKLEKELNIALFDRSKRQITITPQGCELHKNAQRILREYEKMMLNANRLKNNYKDTINIASLPISSFFNLSKSLNILSKQYPNLHIHFDEIEEKGLNSIIEDNVYDILLLRENSNKNLRSHLKKELFSDQLVALGSPENKYAIQDILSITDLKNANIVLPPAYTTISDTFLNHCKKHHIKPTIVQHGRLETLIHLVSNNPKYIAISTKRSLKAFNLSSLKICTFIEPIPCNLCIFYRRNSKYIDQIVKLILSNSKSN